MNAEHQAMAFDIGAINLNFYSGFVNIEKGKNSLMIQNVFSTVL